MSDRKTKVILKVERLTHIYDTTRGSIRALEDVSFEIREGEFVTFLGPSGCGKTTTLRIIAGLITPTSGGILLRGKPLKRASKDIGVVFQQPNLLPWRNLIKNTLLPLEILGLNSSKYRQRAYDLIKLVGLSGFENKYPAELSGGMQQRAAITRALVHNPSILVMDEPFGALDAITREYMNMEILKIWEKTQKTVIFVTHNLAEAVFLSDRVYVMAPNPGRIVEVVHVELPRPRTLDFYGEERFVQYEQLIRKTFEKHYQIGVRFNHG